MAEATRKTVQVEKIATVDEEVVTLELTPEEAEVLKYVMGDITGINTELRKVTGDIYWALGGVGVSNRLHDMTDAERGFKFTGNVETTEPAPDSTPKFGYRMPHLYLDETAQYLGQRHF